MRLKFKVEQLEFGIRPRTVEAGRKTLETLGVDMLNLESNNLLLEHASFILYIDVWTVERGITSGFGES